MNWGNCLDGWREEKTLSLVWKDHPMRNVRYSLKFTNVNILASVWAWGLSMRFQCEVECVHACEVKCVYTCEVHGGALCIGVISRWTDISTDMSVGIWATVWFISKPTWIYKWVEGLVHTESKHESMPKPHCDWVLSICVIWQRYRENYAERFFAC